MYEFSYESTPHHFDRYAPEHPFDALCDPGPLLHRWDRGKVSATIDATEVLQRFARWCAWQVIDLWPAPPIARRFLETGEGDAEAVEEIAKTAVPTRDNEAAYRAAQAAAWAASSRLEWLAPYAAASAAHFAVTAARAADAEDGVRFYRRCRNMFLGMVNAAFAKAAK